ncbi:MAG: sigma-70 family RNA polymerase sigma factor [Chloroflexota bacterium]|nr:sigma-70 family RNA polymerase sigma factor [Chloroflexota bacterium]
MADVVDSDAAGSPGPAAPGDVPGLVDGLFRRQAGQVVATLTRIFGPQHLDLVEDVVQDTLIKALRQWPYRGIPDNPGGWIMRVAKNGALDALRRERSLRDRGEAIARLLAERPGGDGPADDALDSELRDDQLRMMFTCCHPALSREARVALTLKTLGGFGVPEIARAFLASENAIAQRLVRAKRLLREGVIPPVVPDAGELPARLDSVLDVLYLLYNEGYGAHSGEELIRHELCAEAIRLTDLLARHPAGDRPKVHALLALMLLQASRLPARLDAGGDLLLLEDQDRARWDRRMIALGLQALARSATGDELTEYHLQAEIAARHAVAPSYTATDWPRILDAYDALVRLTPSPVVALNRAVAVAMVRGPRAGLAEVARVRAAGGGTIDGYYLLHATAAELHRRAGDPGGGRDGFERALRLVATGPERRFLTRKLRECGGPGAVGEQP